MVRFHVNLHNWGKVFRSSYNQELGLIEKYFIRKLRLTLLKYWKQVLILISLYIKPEIISWNILIRIYWKHFLS